MNDQLTFRLVDDCSIEVPVNVPPAYHDAWARLRVQKPWAVSDDEWRAAMADAGTLLDQWGSLAVEFQWLPRYLFDVPDDGRPGGLVWSLNGEVVSALRPEQAVMGSWRVFDRIALTTAASKWASWLSVLM